MKIKRVIAILMSVICAPCLFACGAPQSDGENDEVTEDNAVAGPNVARVVVLLGQSNMEGASYKTLLRSKGVSKAKYEEYLAGYPNVKISYVVPWNPAQSSRNGFLPTALGMGGQDNRFGPEVGIAEYLTESGYESVFLVKYSYGGTSLHKEWRSPSSGGKTGELYDGAVEYVLNAMATLENADYYPVIDAICWMQGESDADKSEDAANAYFDLQTNFIKDLRDDLAFYGHGAGIGFVDAGISDCALWKYQKTVNDAKYAVAQADELNTYFSTIDAELEYMNEPSYGADIAHFDCLSEIKLGHMFGQSLERYLQRKTDL